MIKQLAEESISKVKKIESIQLQMHEGKTLQGDLVFTTDQTPISAKLSDKSCKKMCFPFSLAQSFTAGKSAAQRFSPIDGATDGSSHRKSPVNGAGELAPSGPSRERLG